jgi:hypothetical protein
MQFMGWLLGLETDSSVDGLSNSICQFWCSRSSSSVASSSVEERSFRTRSIAETLTIEDIKKKLLRLQEEEDEVTRLDEQNRRRMAKLRAKVKQMNKEISRNGGEKVQRWLHDSYNSSDNAIHSTKSFEIVQTLKNSMVTVRSQHPKLMVAGMPQNFVSFDDKTHLNDVSKLLLQQILGKDLPKFSGDVKDFHHDI